MCTLSGGWWRQLFLFLQSVFAWYIWESSGKYNRVCQTVSAGYISDALLSYVWISAGDEGEQVLCSQGYSETVRVWRRSGWETLCVPYVKIFCLMMAGFVDLGICWWSDIYIQYSLLQLWQRCWWPVCQNVWLGYSPSYMMIHLWLCLAAWKV